MEKLRENLNTLQNKSNDFILQLIRSNKYNLKKLKTFNIIENFISANTKISVTDIEWMTGFQASSFLNNMRDSDDSSMAFMMKVRVNTSEPLELITRDEGKDFIVEKGSTIYGIFGGVVSFNDLDKNDFSADNIFIRGFNFSKSKSDIDTEWNYLTEKISIEKRFVNEIDKNKFLLEKIDTLSELDEVGLLDDDTFLDLISYVVELSGDEPKRVWGEYNQVSRTTNEPVLMNKAMAIELDKNQVTGLVTALSMKYEEQLQSIPKVSRIIRSRNGVVPVEFTKTMRGHANPNQVKIVLPKLGDWRMGMNEKYSAELIFHEFAHIVDLGRKSYGSTITSAPSPHKEDFVKVLDKMLVRFSKWINDNYSLENHKEQILTLNTKLFQFRNKKSEIVSEIAKREKVERDLITEERESINKQSGVSDNEYPLHLIFSDEKDLKVKFLEWALRQEIQDISTNSQDRAVLASVLEKILSDKEETLNKEEVNLLNNTVANVSRTKFTFNLPMKEQMTAMKHIKQVISDVEELREGTIAIPETKPSVIIEEYDENLIEDNQEEEMKKIRG